MADLFSVCFIYAPLILLAEEPKIKIMPLSLKYPLHEYYKVIGDNIFWLLISLLVLQKYDHDCVKLDNHFENESLFTFWKELFIDGKGRGKWFQFTEQSFQNSN